MAKKKPGYGRPTSPASPARSPRMVTALTATSSANQRSRRVMRSSMIRHADSGLYSGAVGITRRARAFAVLVAGVILPLGWPMAATAQVIPAAAVLSPNDTQFRPGETIAFGLAVAVPPGNPAADLYVGAVLPDGLTRSEER